MFARILSYIAELKHNYVIQRITAREQNTVNGNATKKQSVYLFFLLHRSLALVAKLSHLQRGGFQDTALLLAPLTLVALSHHLECVADQRDLLDLSLLPA